MPRSISLLRRAEKQIGGLLPQGVSLDGTPHPESLTPRGWQRAGAIVGLFVPRSGASGNPVDLPTPTHLFASEIGPHSLSRRPIETLQPLAERLGLPIGELFLQDEIDGLVSANLACDGDVLVAWEHKRIPLIADRLVSERSTVPQVWPDDRYDIVWGPRASRARAAGVSTPAGAPASSCRRPSRPDRIAVRATPDAAIRIRYRRSGVTSRRCRVASNDVGSSTSTGGSMNRRASLPAAHVAAQPTGM